MKKNFLRFILLVILALTAMLSKAQSTLSPADESWWKLKAGDNSSISASNLALDAAGNGYVINKRGNDYYLSRRQTSGVTDTTWLFLGSSDVTTIFTTDEFTVPNYFRTIVYKPSDGNLYLVWTRRSTPSNSINPMDSVFVGQVSNLINTPVFTKRWKGVDNVFAQYGNGLGGQNVEGLITLNISPSENMYVVAKTRIHKISKAGILTQTFSTPYSYYRTEIYDMTWDNSDNIYVTRRRYKDGPSANVFFSPVDPYITKINSAGVADTTWFKVTDDTLYQNPIRATYANGFIYSSHIVTKQSSDTFYIWKINSTTGGGQLINKWSYPYVSIRPMTFTAFTDSANNVYFSNFYPSVVHRITNTGSLDSAWLSLDGPDVYGPSVVTIGGPGNQMYMGARTVTDNPPGFPPPPFYMPVYSYYYSRLVGAAFNVSINKHNLTCAGANDGTAKAIATGCSAGSYTYLWTPGNFTTDSISGLAAGTFNLRVICGTDTVNRTFTITEPPVVNAPGTSNQTLCSGSTIADLTATGTNIKWYANASGGGFLSSSNLLTDGTVYYASQTIGGCESVARSADSITVHFAATPVTANQSFCGTATVANLIATGNNIQWYSTPSGGTPLSSGTPLTDGIKYYATQTAGSCESAVRAVDSVTVTNTPLPVATNLVIYTGTKTLSRLNVSGTNLQFYTAMSGGTALAGSALVQDDSVYYVSQTINGCEGGRKTIKVNRIANDSAVFCAPATIADPVTTPNAGNNVKWYSSASATTALTPATALAAGTNILYAEEAGSGVPTIILHTNTSDAIAQLNALTLAENDSLYYGYFDDSAKIFRATAAGTDTTLISKGGPGESIRFLQFETDATGRYLLYTTSNFVRRRNLSTGAVTTLGSGYFGPKAVSRDVANNKLYIADTENGRIRVLDLATNISTTADSLDKVQFGGNFFTARPFAVCYSAPNSLYFGDFNRNRVYRKDLTTGVRTDSLTINQPLNIYALANGKIMIVGQNSIITANADLTGITTLVTGAPATMAAQINSEGDLVYADYRDIKKISAITSNRVPVTIVVNPVANVTPVADKIVCNGSGIAAINFATTTVGGTVTYSWTNNNTAIGLAATGTGNIAGFTAINNGTHPDTALVIITPAITNAGITCTGARDSFYIIVNPAAQVNNISTQVVCNNAPVAVNFSTTQTGGTTTYDWTNSNNLIGLAASGSGSIPSFNAINNGTAPVTATITVTPTFTNQGVSCSGTAKTFTVTVNPTATVNTIASQVLCNGSATAAVNLSSPVTGGSIVYNWTNNNAAIGLAASGSGNISSFNAANSTTAPLTAIITVTPVFTNAGVTCTGTATTFTITVNPTITVNSISNKTECNGSVTSPIGISSAASGGTVVFNWTNSNTAIGLAASGTGNIPSYTAINTTNSPITSTITITPLFTNAGVTCTGTTFSFTITVNPPPVFTQPVNQTACNNAVTAVLPFTTALTGGVSSYAWTNNNTSIGLAASGTGSLPSFTAINTTNAPISGTISVVMTYTNAGLSCVSLPQTFTYTVNPTATVSSTSNQVLCNGGATTATNFTTTTTGGTIAYNWSNNNTAIGLAASGTGNITSFNATNTGTAPITATITVTPTITNGGIICAGTANTFTITVNPKATVTTISNKTECNGSVTSPIVISSPTTGGSIVYNWTNSNTAIGLAASGTGNIPGYTATNTATAPVTAMITVTPVYTANAVTCTGTPFSFTITVNPPPVFNAIANQTACKGSATAAVPFTTALTGGTATFSWTNTNTAIGLAVSGTGNLPSFTATNTGNAPISGTITVVMTYTNAGLSCISLPQTFTYTVNPTATVNSISNRVLCNNSPAAAINFSSPQTGGTITYNWTNSNAAIGLAASGTGNIASFNATNTTNAPLVSTITVIPVFNNSINCTGTASTFTITVNPTASINTVANQTVCNNSSTAAVNFSSPTTGGTIVYNWTNDNTAIGLAASGTGDIPVFTATNTSSAAITGTITVTPTYTNGTVSCTGTPIVFTITINTLSSAPTAAVASSPIICGSGTVTLTAVGGFVGTGAAYKWYSGSCGGTFVGSGQVLNNVPVTSTTTYYVRIEGGCNTTACVNVTVTLAPQPVASVTAVYSTNSTPGSPVTLYASVSPTGNYSYQWSRNGTPLPGAVHDTLKVAVSEAGGDYTVMVQSIGTPCTASSSPLALHDAPAAKMFIIPNPNNGLFKVSVYATAEERGSTRMLMVYDSKGARVYSLEYKVSEPYNLINVDITKYSKGLYHLRITDGSGKTKATAEVLKSE